MIMSTVKSQGHSTLHPVSFHAHPPTHQLIYHSPTHPLRIYGVYSKISLIVRVSDNMTMNVLESSCLFHIWQLPKINLNKNADQYCAHRILLFNFIITFPSVRMDVPLVYPTSLNPHFFPILFSLCVCGPPPFSILHHNLALFSPRYAYSSIPWVTELYLSVSVSYPILSWVHPIIISPHSFPTWYS